MYVLPIGRSPLTAPSSVRASLGIKGIYFKHKSFCTACEKKKRVITNKIIQLNNIMDDSVMIIINIPAYLIPCVFSSPELKAQVTYSDCPSSV
jgi:hypothetical protein